MKLSLELIEEIIGYIPDKDLPSCSVIAKSWTRPCQKRLFRVVKIYQDSNLRRWLDKISPVNVELLGYIRVLTYAEYPLTMMGQILQVPHTTGTFREYYPSLGQLRSFTLRLFPTSSLPQPLEIFSAFQYTLSDITLENSSTAISTFVALLNYFPNLMNLGVRNIECCEGDEPIPSLSRLGFKKLSIT